MIQMQTNLDVACNSGPKKVQCIKVLKKGQHSTASIGDEIVVAVKDVQPNSKIKKGEVKRAVVVRTKKSIRRKDGESIKFDGNAAVLIKESGEPIGTRIFGAVTRELRKKFMKIVSLAAEVY